MTRMRALSGLVVATAAIAALALAGCSRATSTSRASSGASASPAAIDPPGTYMGRTLALPMSYQGADWLEREDRETTEQPEHVLDVLGVKDGMTVADVGAGSGYFTVRIANRVGPRGRVLATDLQPEMLVLLRTKVSKANLGNVVPILATESDAKLPRKELDLVLMVDVYHELPRPAATLAQVRVALRPEGRVALVEYRGEDPSVPIKPEHKTTLAQMRRELEANGFVFRSSDESLPQQRIIVFTPAP
jgi:predicted methyltransferase